MSNSDDYYKGYEDALEMVDSLLLAAMNDPNAYCLPSKQVLQILRASINP